MEKSMAMENFQIQMEQFPTKENGGLTNHRLKGQCNTQDATQVS